MQVTQFNMRIGTPGYMSPEQIEGGEIDRRSDIFAVGAVFYELLSYREAFSGTSTRQIENKVLQAAAGSPRVADSRPRPRDRRHRGSGAGEGSQQAISRCRVVRAGARASALATRAGSAYAAAVQIDASSDADTCARLGRRATQEPTSSINGRWRCTRTARWTLRAV